MTFPFQHRTMADVDAWWKADSTPVLLETLFAQGHTYKRLAELLGAPSDKAVFARAKEMGLPDRYPRRETAVAARKATLAAKAASAAKMAPPGWPKAKTCLKCRRKFTSHGPGNHLCASCRTTNFGRAPDLGGMF